MPLITFRIADQTCNPVPLQLQNRGPIVPVAVSISDVQRRSLARTGMPAPRPVTGLALLDTGATVTCIATESAEEAGLPTVGTGRMMSATEESVEVPLYAAKVDIQGFVGINAPQAHGSPALAAQGLVALIGRDVLSRCAFVYNGPDAAFTLSI